MTVKSQSLHPKILELRNKVGTSPFHRSKPIEQPIEIRQMMQSTENPRLLKGYFAVWGEIDDYRTRPVKGCFSKSIEERGPSSKSTYKITMLWQHRQDEPLCKPIILREDEIGLYAEYIPDEGIATCDRAVIQVRSGTVNNGSYGFNYIWDKMKYNEKDDCIDMYECNLFELSPVTIPSQTGTFAVRGSDGKFTDDFLLEETEELIKQIPRKYHLELRSLIDRHIALAQIQPLEQRQIALKDSKPKQGGIDYNFLLKNI